MLLADQLAALMFLPLDETLLPGPFTASWQDNCQDYYGKEPNEKFHVRNLLSVLLSESREIGKIEKSPVFP